jgi:L-2,4-diaminobutyrate decarboxylase
MLGLAAMVSAILNNSSAIYEGAPVAVTLEHRLVSWMSNKVGYGSDAGGALTSGGTLGALTALLAMRQAKVGLDAWGEGLAGSDRYTVFVSEEAHYSNLRACAVLGLGERAVVHLTAIANFCDERELWFHVDASHGCGALVSPKYAQMLDGVERADSVVWDAHKMMLVPSLCTAVLFRNAKHLDAAFRQKAAYLLSDAAVPWHQPASRNFETTKPAMVLPLYVALRTLGVGFFADHLDYAYDLARAFADEIDERADFELLVPPESNIVCFRRRAPVDVSNALQLALRDEVNRRGRFFLMRTVLRDAVWLRVVLMNPSTTLAHLRELLDELSSLPGQE